MLAGGRQANKTGRDGKKSEYDIFGGGGRRDKESDTGQMRSLVLQLALPSG